MIIGLTQRVLFRNGIAYDSIEHGWYSLLKDHTLTFVSNRIDQDFKKLAESLDILIVTGGDDSTIRRITETKLIIEMMIRSKPILGVCHGALLLTHLCGGQVEEAENHYGVDHEIMCDGNVINVNSFHSMKISKVHPNAKSIAFDYQGNCEAWVDGNLCAIMWHPERMINPFIPCKIEELMCWNT